MKKINFLLIIMLSFIIFGINVSAAPTASSNIDYSTCLSFADSFKTITTSSGGTYYYKSCYRATCSYGVYNKANMVSNYGYRCQNGNGTPYLKVTSDGCSSYTGNCNTTNSTYCTKVTYIDCNRTSNGDDFRGNTTTTTTKRTTHETTDKASSTTKRTTTKATTTKRTTTKTTTRKTTTQKTTTRKKSNNTNIKSLKISGQKVKDPNLENYDIKVPYGVSDVDVVVELEDIRSGYIVEGNKGLTDEEGQSFKIVVTAEDGTIKETIFNIIRYTPLSEDCKLEKIEIENYSIDFSKNVYEYKLKLPKEVSNIDMEVTLSDPEHATYEVTGNESLKNKSKILIEVKAEDGTICKYTIKIKKTSNTWKYVLLIVLLVGALVTSCIFLYKYLMKSKGKYKYEV